MTLKDEIYKKTRELLKNPPSDLKELERRFVCNGKLDKEGLLKFFKGKAKTKKAHSYSSDPQKAKEMHREYLKDHPKSNLKPEDFYKEPEKDKGLPEPPKGSFEKITKSFDKQLDKLSKSTGLSKKQIGAAAGGALVAMTLPIFFTGAPAIALAGSLAAYYVGEKAGEKAVEAISGKQAGSLKVPPMMLKGICQWAFRHFAQHHLSRQKEYLQHVNREFESYGDEGKRNRSLVELQILVRFLKQHCKSTTPPNFQMASHNFDLNLEGWNYHGDHMRCQECFPEGLRVELIHPVRWMDTFMSEGIDEPEHIRGQYLPSDQKLRIRVPLGILRSKDQAEVRMRELANTVRHELQHFTQHLLRMLSGLESGAPKSKTLNGNPINDYRVRDLEFKPLLEDEVEQFIKGLRNVRSRGTEITPNVIRFLIHQWTGSISGSGIKRKFFADLKRSNPLKYQQACKEFYQMVIQFLRHHQV